MCDGEELRAAIPSKKINKSLTTFLTAPPTLVLSLFAPLSPTSPLYTAPLPFHSLLFLLRFYPHLHPHSPLVSPGGSCQSSASPTIPLELIVPAVAGGGRHCEAAESRRWREHCQSLSLIINFCHSGPRGSHKVRASHTLHLSLPCLLLTPHFTHPESRPPSLRPSLPPSSLVKASASPSPLPPSLGSGDVSVPPSSLLLVAA